MPNAIVATSICVPILNRARNTGASVTTGSARPNCSSGSRYPDTAGDRPIATPSGIPITVAMASPASVRQMLGSRFPVASAVRKTCAGGPENHRWYIRARIADGGGKNGL